MDRIDLFRIFVRVVDSSSFTRAANTLGLPRPSVSAAIKDLEARMGARLLHRTTRKVAPTQDGLALYERCLRLLSDFEETEGLFRQAATGPAGRLRVDLPGRIGRLIVAPALAGFLDLYPEIDVDLGVTDRTVDLVEDSLDCVLRVGPLSDSGLIARFIGDLPLINVASPTYLERHGVPQRPEDLDRHLAVNYASPTTGRVEPWEWVGQGGVQTRSVCSRVVVNGSEAYIACCLAGHGLIQIPAFDVKSHLAAGDLIEVMPDYRAASMPMTLLFPHRRHFSRRVQLFADWLEALLKREVLMP